MVLEIPDRVIVMNQQAPHKKTNKSTLRRLLGDAFWRLVARRRMVADRVCDEIAEMKRPFIDIMLRRLGQPRGQRFSGVVLIDGMWDNPNHWLRYSLLRAALGLAAGDEIAIVSGSRSRFVGRAARRLGFSRTVDYDSFLPSEKEITPVVDQLLSEINDPVDIMDWKLPFGFPGEYAYDQLQKWQRVGVVNIKTVLFRANVHRLVGELLAADRVLSAIKPDLLVLSHAIGISYGGLAWRASQLRIPAIVVTGDGGGIRYWRANVVESKRAVFMLADYSAPA